MWYIVPTCSPNLSYFKIWKDYGYKIAAQVTTNELADKIRNDVDEILITPFTSLPHMFNMLETFIRSKYRCVLAACDETYPSSNHKADELVEKYFSIFPDGNGILSPKGDSYGCQVCVQNPIIGEYWARQHKVFPEGYYHFYADTELYFKAKSLGKLVEDGTISFYHDHWLRRGKQSEHFNKSKSLEYID